MSERERWCICADPGSCRQPIPGYACKANLRPCPFCGGRVDPQGWMDGDGRQGPECESCGATAPDEETWQARIAEQREAELMECLRERDGGAHDTDCPAFRAEGRPCKCGHEEAAQILARYES